LSIKAHGRALRAPALVLLLLVCVGCADRQVATVAPLPPPDPHTQMAALEQRIFDLVQDERYKIDPKAKTLVLDSELIGVARERSADMATKNYFAHASPNGQTSATIIMDKDADFQGLLGENLAAQHYLTAQGVDIDVFARRFVDSWLASPSHKDNLAFAGYDRSGVGAAVNGDTIYVTQLFATDLGLPKPAPAKRPVTQFNDPASATAHGASAPPPQGGSNVPIPVPRPPQSE
jgi:uncharacterized protein YkwD